MIWKCLGTFYSLDTLYKAMDLQGLPSSKGFGLDWSWHSWKDLDIPFLKRYGTWKSNGWIKSYGCRKLVVHRSVC